jgi:hypothetical protein
MGIPAGKPKTIAVDLTGKFLSASREVRIVTNLCVYWDEIFLSEETAAPPVRLTASGRIGRPALPRLLHAGDSSAAQAAGRLRLRAVDAGLDVESHQGALYALWRRAAAGGAIDDRLVIMGSGDELRLLFPERAAGPLPAGWKRDFLLFVDGWAKDADANTAYSQTVEPLPFHAMSQYPYPRTGGERFPDDAAHRQYREQYNTRPALRLIRPLTVGETSFPAQLNLHGRQRVQPLAERRVGRFGGRFDRRHRVFGQANWKRLPGL